MSAETKIACPNCNQQMEEGYLVGYSGLQWTADEKSGRHIVTNINTEILHSENEGAVMENPRYSASRCRGCMLLMVRYKELR